MSDGVLVELAVREFSVSMRVPDVVKQQIAHALGVSREEVMAFLASYRRKNRIRVNKPCGEVPFKSYGKKWRDMNEVERGHYREWKRQRRAREAVAGPLPRSLREEVFLDAGDRCKWCGRLENLSLDHIVALKNGGTNERSNLQCLCRNCNSMKGDR